MLPEKHDLVIGRDYKYCPWCSAHLVEKKLDGRVRLKCPSCNFIWYKNPIPAAGAILIQDNKILLVKRKYPPRAGDWSLPAGFMEYNESPVQCCIRELKEETGLNIKIERLFWVYAGHDDPRSHAALALYLAKINGGKMVPGDDAEEVRYFELDETPPNIAFQAHIEAIADIRKYLRTGKMPNRQ